VRVPDPAEDFIVALDELLPRFAAVAAAPDTVALTEPDPALGERWDRGQVWAHLVEFVPYWMEQIQHVIEAESDQPVPFGRVKTDPDRIAAIQAGRHHPVAGQWEELENEIGDLKAFLTGLADEEWDRTGEHPTLGTMTVPQMVERFLVDHLDEHATQLESLAEPGERETEGS
jgi:hypothetical protein